MTYSATKFEVATYNGLGGATFTRNVPDGRWTDFGTNLSKERSRYMSLAKFKGTFYATKGTLGGI